MMHPSGIDKPPTAVAKALSLSENHIVAIFEAPFAKNGYGMATKAYAASSPIN